jgi:hypothetical protein
MLSDMLPEAELAAAASAMPQASESAAAFDWRQPEEEALRRKETQDARPKRTVRLINLERRAQFCRGFRR